MDSSSDSEEETLKQEINQLKAVLEGTESSETSSQYSSNSSGNRTSFSKVQRELSKIDDAIALNKLTDEKLRRLEGILIGRLRECRQRLKDIDGSPVTLSDQDKVFRYINCGKPYFKTRDGFAAPDNEDAKVMVKSQMYDLSTVTTVPGWTVKDKTEFLSLIVEMSREKRKACFNSQIAQLKRDARGKETYVLEKCISEIKNEIYNLRKKTLSELALPLDEEYDWDTIANKTNYRHSAQEYRSLWRLFLHPSTKKTTWTKTEQAKLKHITVGHAYEDWDDIAAELDTQRTGYQCFVFFRTNVNNNNSSIAGQKWSKEEEEYLKRLINCFREGDYIPWCKIASAMENRTKIQIYNKYSRLVEQRKGRFLPEEDAVILTSAKEFGPNFRKIMRHLPGRSLAQLRVRYNVLANRNNTKTSIVWSVDDDRKLLQLMTNQDCTTNYSSVTQHFPGKDRAHIRARYLTLLKWMRKHPTMDISRAPRRGARRLGHGEASEDINKAVENLKKRIHTEVKSKRSSKITKDSEEDAIDTAIVAALINEQIKEDELKKNEFCQGEQQVLKEYCDGSSIPSNINNLRQLLILLRAKLKKTLFKDSSFADEYAGLLQNTTERCLLVKSYSKKNTVRVFNMNTPDIWGNKLLKTSEHVLPPNYSTITGCRKLMAYVSTKANHTNEKQWNLGINIKRNASIKDCLDVLMERFNMLFLWPMLLSNESPAVRNEHIPRGPRSPVRKRLKLVTSGTGITIPVGAPYGPEATVNDNIDLNESPRKNDSVMNVYVGSDDFMYMKQ